MRTCISRKESFTQEMRDRFVEKLIRDVAALSEKHADIIVSQALYKESNRKMVVDAFPEAKFVQVQVDLKTLTERLKIRGSEVDEKYARKLMINFEEPVLEHYVLHNDADTENVLHQFRDFLSTSRPSCSKK